MEGNYQPGFYNTERDQLASRHPASLPPQQQQQQHVAHYPLELPIPYHTTPQHPSEFVVDQPHRAFHAPQPVGPVFRSIYESAPMLPSSNIVQHVRQQPPFTLGGHGVKSSTQSINHATPTIATQEPVIERNVPHSRGETTVPQPSSKNIQSKKRKEQCPTSKHQPSAPSNNSAVEPPLLTALNLKKNSIVISPSQELPKGLSFKVTSEDKVDGVVAKETLEKGVEFGPYTGTLVDEDLGWSKDSTWEICMPGGVFFYIDGRKNWMSHLRCAQSEEQQNMEAFQCYGDIFFRSTKVIEPGSELRVFYSEKYKKRVAIQTRLQDLKFDQDAQKFQCSLCEGLFTSVKPMLRHIRCEHVKGKPDEMIPVLTWKKKKKKLAENDDSSKQQLEKEKKVIDREELVFKCDTCEKVFPSCGRLKAHELFHDYSEKHACPVCGKKQKTARTLANHMITHEPDLFKCKKCNKKYQSKSALDKHERVHGYQCRVCSENFSRKNECLKHERTHPAFKSLQSAVKIQASTAKVQPSELSNAEPKDMLGKSTNYYLQQRPFKCRFCPKRYVQRNKVDEHEKEVHTGEGAFKCSHCPRVFTSEFRMMDHVKCHEQNRIYRCTLCPRSFASERALNNHQGEHTGLKPFKCEICGKGFGIKKNVSAHRRRMHQEQPKRFFCSVCNKGFTDKGNLIKHERRHKGIRPFVCLECGKAFTGKWNLAVHKQAMHTAEKAFSCEICSKTFSLNQNYNYHMYKHRVQADKSSSIQQ